MSKRRLRYSLATRLAVLFALASGLLLAAIGQYLNGALAKQVAAQHQEHLNSMLELVIHQLDQIPSLETLTMQPQVVMHLLIGHGDLKVWVYDAQGQPLLSSSESEIPRELWGDTAAANRHPSAARFWDGPGRQPHRFVVTAYKSAEKDAHVVLALDVSDEAAILNSFRTTILGAIASGSLLAAIMGLLIARRSMRPVVRIAASARRISASSLDERLDPSGTPDELAALVESFNTTLSRLEDSFRRLSDFSADLAHELRTPLSNLLVRTQVVLSQKRNADEYREALETGVEDIQQLSALVSDMLFLAQADHAQAALTVEKVDLRAEAGQVAEFFAALAEERAIELKVEGAGLVEADRQKIRRVLANLVSNAIRHSPDRAPVNIAIRDSVNEVAVSVTNQGVGIPAEHQARIFDRFYRADSSRTRASGGTGLGLAIVRSIVKLHGGHVNLRSDSDATVFEFSLPSFNRSPPVIRGASAAGSLPISGPRSA